MSGFVGVNVRLTKDRMPERIDRTTAHRHVDLCFDLLKDQVAGLKLLSVLIETRDYVEAAARALPPAPGEIEPIHVCHTASGPGLITAALVILDGLCERIAAEGGPVDGRLAAARQLLDMVGFDAMRAAREALPDGGRS